MISHYNSFQYFKFSNPIGWAKTHTDARTLQPILYFHSVNMDFHLFILFIFKLYIPCMPFLSCSVSRSWFLFSNQSLAYAVVVLLLVTAPYRLSYIRCACCLCILHCRSFSSLFFCIVSARNLRCPTTQSTLLPAYRDCLLSIMIINKIPRRVVNMSSQLFLLGPGSMHFRGL